MIYLQSVRSGRLNDSSLVAQSYGNMAQIYAGQLATELRNLQRRFDAVVAPPSNRSDGNVYRNSIIAETGARDITDRFSRKGMARAATASSVSDMVEEFNYKAGGDEAEIESLLIVDESVASGKTCAAVLHHLRTVRLKEKCKITVAAAAWRS